MRESRAKDITKEKRNFRAASVDAVNADNRTVELAFSSEEPVARWFGQEVLDHSQGAIVMSRLNDGAPLLLNHDDDQQIGVVESVSIGDDRRGRAVVRFGKSELASEIFQDVQDGIRKHVSVGYMIHEAKLTGERDGEEEWTVTSWEPFEISIVPVPADISVGVGRNIDQKPSEESAEATGDNVPLKINLLENNTRNLKMTPEELAAAEQRKIAEQQAEQRKGSEAETSRVRSILEIGKKYGAVDMAADFAGDSTKSVADFHRALLEQMNGRKQAPIADSKEAEIGMTDKEARNYSLLRVIRALANPTDSGAQKAASFEFAASRAAADKLGKDTERLVVPMDVLTRALNTSTAGTNHGDTGGFGIATNLLAGSFVDMLRNRATIMQLGTVMGGLVGNIDIPKQTSAATGYWLNEDEDSTESELDLGQISMSPKTVAARSEITRKLMIQSSLDAEALVRFDLAKQLALTIDKAGYYGTGSNAQPLGIANQSGISVVGFAGANPTFAELVQMETDIALLNADVEGMAYVGNAALRGYAKTALKFPATAASGTIWEPGNTVNGYRTEVTNQVANGDVFFGNFADMLIGMWGGLELIVNPYSGAKSGRLEIVMFQDVDFALRRAQSFAIGRKV